MLFQNSPPPVCITIDVPVIVQPDKNKRFDWLISGPSKAVLDRQTGGLDREIEGLLQSTNKKDDKKFFA